MTTLMAQGPLDRKVMRPTDGPWEVVTADRGYIITALGGCYDVAVVRNIGNQNNQANAVLIAAAPMMLDAMERCYRMLLSDPDAKGALFKAENILRETIASAQARTHNAEVRGAQRPARLPS